MCKITEQKYGRDMKIKRSFKNLIVYLIFKEIRERGKKRKKEILSSTPQFHCTQSCKKNSSVHNYTPKRFQSKTEQFLLKKKKKILLKKKTRSSIVY